MCVLSFRMRFSRVTVKYTSSNMKIIKHTSVETLCVCAVFGGLCLLMTTAPSSAKGNSRTVSPEYDGSLVISAFNIKVFGVNKVSDPVVVDELVKILQRYDLVFIQEIRDISETAIYTLLDALNRDVGDKYEMVVSDRLGRTSSKEQYAYMYKPSRLTLLWQYVYDDSTYDKFEREPFVAYFESPTTAVDRFAVIGVHIRPSDAVEELNQLVNVYDDFVAKSSNKNAIIAGDFNADCNYVSDTALRSLLLRSDERFRWITPDDLDTTVAVSNCSYDRMIIAGDELFDNVHPNRTGAFHFDQEYGLDIDAARRVSDHYPIEMVLQGNLADTFSRGIFQKPTEPLSFTTSDSVSCSGSFRTVVWMCLLVVAQQVDMPAWTHRVP